MVFRPNTLQDNNKKRNLFMKRINKTKRRKQRERTFEIIKRNARLLFYFECFLHGGQVERELHRWEYARAHGFLPGHTELGHTDFCPDKKTFLFQPRWSRYDWRVVAPLHAMICPTRTHYASIAWVSLAFGPLQWCCSKIKTEDAARCVQGICSFKATASHEHSKK